jgi:hypothetical protein
LLKAISTQITKVIDDSGFPTFVECIFVDARGKRHEFFEKVPVVSAEHITTESEFPIASKFACEVESEWVDSSGLTLVRVNTQKPWGIESTSGISIFDVLPSQLDEIPD